MNDNFLLWSLIQFLHPLQPIIDPVYLVSAEKDGDIDKQRLVQFYIIIHYMCCALCSRCPLPERFLCRG